jgi:hypothetical protein
LVPHSKGRTYTEDVTGWGAEEELHDFYSLTKNSWGDLHQGRCNRWGMTAFGRPRHRWKNNIKRALKIK